jgi:hypothetical protein
MSSSRPRPTIPWAATSMDSSAAPAPDTDQAAYERAGYVRALRGANGAPW